MREIKFDSSKTYYDNDDIAYAFSENGLSSELENIESIVAEVCGANDEFPWYWILLMKDGQFAWATGACDYTGWDCRSSASIHKAFKTPEEAIDAVVVEYDDRSLIKETLLDQINDLCPFALYPTPASTTTLTS